MTAILNRWICRRGLPLEFVTDQGKEFTNKMAQHLFDVLDVHHSMTASYHPQCNSQAEVCNKTIAQYLSTDVKLQRIGNFSFWHWHSLTTPVTTVR